MRPERPICGKGTTCGERRVAMRAGECYYSQHYRGWIYPAEDRHVPRELTQRGHAPFVWTSCPFCGGPLPTVFDAVREVMEDTGEGEEAG